MRAVAGARGLFAILTTSACVAVQKRAVGFCRITTHRANHDQKAIIAAVVRVQDAAASAPLICRLSRERAVFRQRCY